MTHPARKVIVEKTIETHQTFIAGPVELVEGGIAFISYTPIFISDNNGKKNKFWGVTDIVIKRDELFREANITISNNKYNFALRGEDGKGKSGATFWGDSSVFHNNPVSININLPTGNWELASVPISGWGNIHYDNSSYILYISALIISLLTWLLTNALIKLKNNERELKAIFTSMQDLIIEFNFNGDYVKIAPTSENYLRLPRNQLLGKNLREVFTETEAEYFIKAIKQCIATKDLQIIEYKMINHKNEELWFQARISYISDNSVIYLANDNTFKKNFEFKLIESENRLKLLNSQKDKFFSIIAHDLKSPFFGFLNLTKVMSNNIEDFTQIELKDYSMMMYESANNLYKLLENLLQWSRVQRGLCQFNPVKLSAHNFATMNINLLCEFAKKKNICIENNIPKEIELFADEQMLNTVMRNLISNAIKFTCAGGKAEIGYIIDSDTHIVFVKDTGVGISNNTIEKLFKIDEKVSTPGTEGETSTGLGLLLCKEFIDKHNGKIWVKSKIDVGTTFFISLPKSNNYSRE